MNSRDSWVKFSSLFKIPLRNGLTKPSKIRGEGFKMVNMGELFAHPRISDISMERVPLSERETDSYLLQIGDLLFARRSLTVDGAGKCSIVQDLREPTTYEGSLIRVRLDPQKCNPLYYFYFFKSPIGRLQIETIIEQVAVAGIRSSDLANLRVPFPLLDEQNEIANLLSQIDDKIELNQRMNQTLEEIARTIFKSWFVDFDPVRAKVDGRDTGLPAEIADLFPDSFEKSMLGQIPKGWRTCPLSEIAVFTKGVSYRSEDLIDSDTALVTLKSIKRGGGYSDKGLKPYAGLYRSSQELVCGDTVIAQTDLTQAREVIGRAARVQCDPVFKHLVASLDLVIVRGREMAFTPDYIYGLLASSKFKEHADGYANGTTVLHLGRMALPDYLFVCPPIRLVLTYSDFVHSLYMKVDGNSLENKTLQAITNHLLPKLMSGEMVVPSTSNKESQ